MTDVNTVEVTDVTYDPNEVLAKLVKLEDGYHVIDHDGTMGPVCTKMTVDGYLILTPNASNRKNINFKNAEKFFAENPDGCIEFTYKPTRKVGAGGTKMPNEKLIAYLSPEEQEEYKAIIARAIAARDAAKAQPKTELEKAREKAEKAMAAYNKLLAMIADTDAE